VLACKSNDAAMLPLFTGHRSAFVSTVTIENGLNEILKHEHLELLKWFVNRREWMDRIDIPVLTSMLEKISSSASAAWMHELFQVSEMIQTLTKAQFERWVKKIMTIGRYDVILLLLKGPIGGRIRPLVRANPQFIQKMKKALAA
jgi:hypothetical protein